MHKNATEEVVFITNVWGRVENVGLAAGISILSYSRPEL